MFWKEVYDVRKTKEQTGTLVREAKWEVVTGKDEMNILKDS